MPEPEPTTRGAIVDLAAVGAAMRHEDAYLREGHTARTLVREPDLRIVLVVMKAGARIAEHRTNDTASIHTVSGHVRLHLQETVADLPAGRLLVLERALRHNVEAIDESAVLLTLGWQTK